MRNSLLFIALACIACSTFSWADDYEPKICATAVTYRGPDLHPPVAPTAFPKADDRLEGALDPSLSAKLDGIADWILKNTKAPALTAAVGIPGQGIWSVSRGQQTLDPPTPLGEKPYFHWASVGKTFTSTVIHQLVLEQKLDYSDPLAKWYPDFPNAAAITIDHLLTHTNGIFSFNADLVFQRQRGYKSPEQCLAIAVKHGCAFCPGEFWAYSNTGYVLLGRIIEKIEGRPLHEVFTARIIRPLGLNQTVALAPRQELTGLAPGHVDGKRDPNFEPTTPYAAGIIASTADDMLHFWQELLTGRLTSPDSVQESFARLYPMFEPSLFYGRGVMLVEVPTMPQKSTWLAHAGGTPGLKSILAYDVGSRLFVAVALNGNAPAEATANKLLQEVKAFQAARSSSR